MDGIPDTFMYFNWTVTITKFTG